MEATALATALKPTDPDDGDIGRRLRGLLIAAQTRIQKTRLGYKVPSQSGKGFYTVIVRGDEYLCSCADFEERNLPCKHVYAVEATVLRDELGGEIPAFTGEEEKEAKKPTYPQDWDAYDRAQLAEQSHFEVLLRELCDLIIQPAYTGGRPCLPVSDMAYTAGLKIYSGMSRRRLGTTVQRAYERDLIDQVPAHSSISRYLKDENLTPVLKHLIQQSSLPVKTIETEFATDATAFSTSVYDRWFDEKHRRPRREARWIKLHAAYGVKTQIITAAEASAGKANDSPFFPTLLDATSEGFDVRVATADKGYLSRANYEYAAERGIEAYIPFKSDSVEIDPKRYRSRPWERAYAYFQYHREEFLRRYHVRSMSESGFGAIKARFGEDLKGRTETSQFNEVLTRVLCHNICVLIRVAYDLGIESELETWVADAAAEQAAERATERDKRANLRAAWDAKRQAKNARHRERQDTRRRELEDAGGEELGDEELGKAA